MPLRGNQIFVQCSSLEALSDALDRALRRQKPPAVERNLLALHAEGWAVILEEDREGGGLARLLSELLSARAIAVELDGAALSLRLRDYASGEPGAASEAPRFRDVEALAWTFLEELKIPAALRLFGHGAVELLGPGLEGGEDAGVAALCATVSPAGVRIEERRAVPPERKEDREPPSAPDLLVASQAGESRALEVRALAGTPTPGELTALAEVEEAQALRLATRLAAQAEGPRIARPGFVYQGNLDERQLHRARAKRPWLARILDPEKPAPLSHGSSTCSCRATLARELPEARVLRAHALRLELAGAAEGVSLRVPLAESYAAYLRDEREEPEEHAARVAGSARARLAAGLSPLSTWTQEELLAALLPTLIPTSRTPGRASELFTPSLCSALLVDDGQRIAPVDRGSLDALGLSYGEALARAIANAESRTLAAPEGVTYFDLEQGRVLICDFDDPGGAGRLLSPLARALFLQVLGGFCYAAVPTRDALLACSPEDPDALDWLVEESRRRFAEGPFPVHPGLVQVTGDGVEEVAADGFWPVG